MDVDIFFEVAGNLLFAAIIFLIIVITSLFSLFSYTLKGMAPIVIYLKELLGQKVFRSKYFTNIKGNSLLLYFGNVMRPKYNQRKDYYEVESQL